MRGRCDVGMLDERQSGGQYRLRCTKCGARPGVLIQAMDATLCALCLEVLARLVRQQLKRDPRTPVPKS